MGYLFKRGGTWWISYWQAGKRVRESARTVDRKRAAALLADKAGQGKAAPVAGRWILSVLDALRVPVPSAADPEAVLLGALVGRARTDEIAVALAARLRLWSEQAAADPREAGRLARFRRELGAILAGEQAVKMPLADAFAAFAAAPRRRPIRAGTLEAHHRPAWSRFEKWATARGRACLHEVTEGDALDYLSHLEAEDLSPASRRNARAVLRAVWNALRVPAGLTANPWTATPAPESEPTHRHALTVAEIRDLFDAAHDPEDRAALALGLFAALRLGDVCRLRWAAVDFAAGVLRVTQSKTGRALEIPMHPYLVNVLRPLAAGPADPVCPRLAELYRQGRALASQRMARIFEAAKIATVDQAEAGETRTRAHSRGTFHALRHTFATLAAAAGAPPSAVAAVTGHRTAAVLEAYTHADLAQARRAVAALQAPAPTRRRQGKHANP